jgi:hypothetical protein
MRQVGSRLDNSRLEGEVGGWMEEWLWLVAGSAYRTTKREGEGKGVWYRELCGSQQLNGRNVVQQW